MHFTATDIFNSLPQRFRTEKAEGLRLCIHIILSGKHSLQHTVKIENGSCRLSADLQGTPDCVVTATEENYVALETGKLNPQWALMSGKVKVSNLPAMMQFVKCFRKFSPEATAHAAISYTQRVPRNGPLAGVKILDFTRLLPGPLATMFLADLGADVVKVEEPAAPDYVRDYEPRIGEESLLYLSFNKNKRSLAVDFRQPAGRTLIEKLVQQCDVLVEQFRPGAMQEWGLGYQQLSAINPRLIYVSLTGYGHGNTFSQQAGHDLNYMAMSGLLDLVGDADAVSVPGFQAADVAGGSYMLMNAVMAALLQRMQTGRGDFVDVSMTDAVQPLAAIALVQAQGEKRDLKRGNELLSGRLPGYNVYRCADNRWLALAALEPKFWNNFCLAMGKPEWQNVLIAGSEEQHAVKKELAAIFASRDRGYWLNHFADADVCLTPVISVGDVFDAPLQQQRNSFATFEQPGVGNYRVLNQPMKFLSVKFDSNNWRAPLLGEDTTFIAKELGYDEKQIAELIQSKVIHAP